MLNDGGKPLIESRKEVTFMNAIMTAKNAVEAAKARYDSLKATVEDLRDKVANFNPKKWKTAATVLGIIAGILIIAALVMSIIALVKSCKASKRVNACDGDCCSDFEYYLDDEDYDFSLDDHIITENDVPDEDDISF